MPTDFSDTVLGYMNAARNFGVDLGKSLVCFGQCATPKRVPTLFIQRMKIFW